MLRLTRALLPVGAALLILAPAAQAHARSPRTLRLRVPVPAAHDVSVMSFELSIGGEGKHHRKQPVGLHLVNHKQRGVFALAQLRPVHGHPGRFLGVLEVFHRASAAAAALPSGLTALSRSPPFASAHAAMGPYDEFSVRAFNERLIKEQIKDNIVTLAQDDELGPDEFCDPFDEEEYVEGNELIFESVLVAGPVLGLPTNTTLDDLARDAADELCDEVEESYLGSNFQIGPRYDNINTLLRYLGAKERIPTTTPPATMPPATTPPATYSLGFSGTWAFEGTAEVKLVGMFTGVYSGSGAPPSSLTTPVEAIKIMLPPAGSMGRTVSNEICPSQLPIAAVITTKTADDTLMCGGGTLPLNQSFSVNVETLPPPSSGMGGVLYAEQNGTWTPFTFTGP
jgi:hypothetical protein